MKLKIDNLGFRFFVVITAILLISFMGWVQVSKKTPHQHNGFIQSATVFSCEDSNNNPFVKAEIQDISTYYYSHDYVLKGLVYYKGKLYPAELEIYADGVYEFKAYLGKETMIFLNFYTGKKTCEFHLSNSSGKDIGLTGHTTSNEYF